MAKRIFITTTTYIGRFFEVFFACIVVYFLAYWILSRIPTKLFVANKSQERMTIYVTSNGVHTDFVVPIENEYRNWGETLELSEEFEQDTSRKFIAIGWGDKNFFLKTKNWSDLTAGTALKATFGLGTGAMHIVQTHQPNPQDANTIAINISKDDYRALCTYVDGNFVKNGDQLSRIKKHPYSQYDFFFDANSTYSLWYTCNSWTNSGLKACNQRACLWTPFRDGIFVQYGK